MKELIIDAIAYGSQGDETAFFSWLTSIEDVINVFGQGLELHVELKSDCLSDEPLREFIALFNRYGIPMKALAQFRSKQNESWFYGNREAYWHESVFACDFDT